MQQIENESSQLFLFCEVQEYSKYCSFQQKQF